MKNEIPETIFSELSLIPLIVPDHFDFLALCQMMLVKRNLRIIWTEQKEENLFLFCLFG
ncbi:hypothetical protein ABXM78_09180 [Enterococcus faecium]|uniref:hypothetical protein n=1 Tax=Enterococcus faecium TaxID=1352 RepID=UPI00338DA9F9